MRNFSQYVKQSGPFQVSYLVTSIWVLVRVVFFCQFPVRLGAQRERESVTLRHCTCTHELLPVMAHRHDSSTQLTKEPDVLVT